jgi:hypothetical protein
MLRGLLTNRAEECKIVGIRFVKDESGNLKAEVECVGSAASIERNRDE